MSQDSQRPGVAQWKIVERKQAFGDTLYHHLQVITLKMETANSSNMLVRSYDTAGCCLPEGCATVSEFVTNLYTEFLPSVLLKTAEYYVTRGVELHSHYLLVT